MKLVKIHRILSFKQSNWLKSYVGFNTRKRRKSPDEFSKQLYKLLTNSKKTMEKVLKISAKK